MTDNVDLNELLDKEIAKEAGITEDARPAVASTNEEKAIIDQQLNNFTAPEAPAEDAKAANEIPGVEIGPDGTIVSDAPAEGTGDAQAPKPADDTKPATPPASA